VDKAKVLTTYIATARVVLQNGKGSGDRFRLAHKHIIRKGNRG